MLTLFLLAFSIWATVSQSVLRQTTLLTSARLSLMFLLSFLSALALLATWRSSQTVLHSRQRSKSQTKQLYLEKISGSQMKIINRWSINQPVSFRIFSCTSVSFARWNVWVTHKKGSLEESCYFWVKWKWNLNLISPQSKFSFALWTTKSWMLKKCFEPCLMFFHALKPANFILYF